MGTPEYLSMMRLRKIWAEGSFSVLKREHCISKIRKRGILAATEECLLAAMALNLKRMAKCHLSLSPNLLFCWNHCGFQQFFCFCQQVPYLTLSESLEQFIQRAHRNSQLTELTPYRYARDVYMVEGENITTVEGQSSRYANPLKI